MGNRKGIFKMKQMKLRTTLTTYLLRLLMLASSITFKFEVSGLVQKKILYWHIPKFDIQLGHVKNCQFNNCYVETRNQFKLPFRINRYSAILFTSNQIKNIQDIAIFTNPDQRFVFIELESSDYYPICPGYYENFFDWTITYRLDSTMPWTYFTVKSLKTNKTVGPGENVRWISDTSLHLSNKLKRVLGKKSRMLAWYVSNCSDRSGRQKFASKLKSELKKYNETFDMYGDCGRKACPKSQGETCHEIIEKNYLFYLAAENSFAKDYITEKVLKAYHHKAVPIVYGAANYTRFLPPGSYIDGRKLGPTKLAELMIFLAENTQEYYKYFNWYNHYKFTSDPNNEAMCRLCTRLNNDTSKIKIKNFRSWWNKDYNARCTVKPVAKKNKRFRKLLH